MLSAIVACAAWIAPLSIVARGDDLARSFQNPPPSARPWVYWFFMDGNMSRDGITADLDAMARVGIGGVIMMEVNVGVPRGPIEFMSPEWRAHFKHAVTEAERLGIQITLNAGPGWTGSGGPWVTPEQSMQHLVASETRVVGPARIHTVLPKPSPRPPYFPGSALPGRLQNARDSFYRDVAVLAFPSTTATNQIADVEEKALYIRHPYTSRPGTKPFLPAPAEFPSLPPGAAITTDQIIDLTERIDAQGRLTWDAPTGAWTILRLGRTSTGANTRPAPIPGLGLECDKFDRAALEAHFDAYVGALLREIGPRKQSTDSGWNMLHIDSWEMGAQNWSAAFREEFRKRRGYDPVRYLPTLTGRIVESPEISERFLWDLRQTAQELVLQNHARYLKELGRRHGFGLSIEPYDMNPCADMALGAVADVPMCEFWLYGFNSFFSVIEAASIAHTGGRPIIAAEAFTSSHAEGWQAHPAALKSLGDWAFCAGVNRIAFHRYQHQPWRHRRPGMTMGPYGVHWERTQIWWDMSTAYHEYLARCQFVLRRGLPVADVLFLCAEGAPHVFRPPTSATRGDPPDRLGYNFDGCAPETLLDRVSSKDGVLMLPDGMSYRVLVLPERDTMTPALLRKVTELVRDGATVIGPRPLKSPSLSGYPKCDAEIRELADGLWGDCDGTTVRTRASGNGRVFWQRPRQPKATLANDNPLAESKWIWRADQAPATSAPVGKCTFRRTVPIESNAPIESAHVFMTADNSFALSVNGRRAGTGDNFHRLSEIDVAAMLTPGTNILSVIVENGGDAPNPAGLIGALIIRYSNGRTLSAPTDRQWLCAQTPEDLNWSPTVELGPSGMAPWKLDAKPNPPEPEQYGDFTDVTRVLAQMSVSPDFESTGPIRYTHRRDRDTDIYFVANTTAQEADADCTFRVTDRTPALWDPLTGEIRDLPESHAAGERTMVPIRFEPYQSWFVVFRPKDAPPARAKNFPILARVGEVTGPWEVAFDPASGGPPKSTFDSLQDWTSRPEEGIRFYSGIATYKATFDASESANALDLGIVHNIARVRLNGHDLGSVWCAPWRVDISRAVRRTGNLLEIDVANLWPNRLIGDEQFPDDCTTHGNWLNGRLPDWPDWLLRNQPRPEPRRMTFTTFKHWRKDDPLLPSGLLGPVIILSIH